MAGMTLRVPGFTPVPVHAHDGSVWDVGVEWLPRTPRLARWYRRRMKGADVNPFSVGDGGDGRGGGGGTFDLDLQDLAAAVAVVIATIALALLLVFVVVPALLLVVDVLVLVVAALVALALKVLLRRPWRVVARCTAGPSEGEEQVREVVGVRSARRARDGLRAAITAGGGRSVSVLPQE